MNNPVRRFNLRSRKSMKLSGQIKCSSCNRYYFHDEYYDQTDGICCDCEKKSSVEAPQTKKRAILRKSVSAIKTGKIQADPDQNYVEKLTGSEIDSIRGNEPSNGGMTKIHFTELLNIPANISNINSAKPINVKQEKSVSAPLEVMKPKKLIRVLGNKTNTIQTQEMDEDEQKVAETKNEITKNDTVETLREKFPHANAFEFEYLMFVRERKSLE